MGLRLALDGKARHRHQYFCAAEGHLLPAARCRKPNTESSFRKMAAGADPPVLCAGGTLSPADFSTGGKNPLMGNVLYQRSPSRLRRLRSHVLHRLNCESFSLEYVGVDAHIDPLSILQDLSGGCGHPPLRC